MLRALPLLLLPGLFGCGLPAHAQEIVGNDEYLVAHRPEAWAMGYFTSATTMTAFGLPPELQPGDVRLAAEAGSLPHLDQSARRVGFNGEKLENLNKSPVFGRARMWVGLPGKIVAEIGYTPPFAVGGARPRDLFAVAISRRIIERGGHAFSLRVLGQHGAVSGDFTCPAELAGTEDPSLNPYGCDARSKDRVELNAYGAEVTFGRTIPGPQWHATMGLLRMEPEVQVDALTFGFRDRSRLNSRDNQPYLAVGAGHEGPLWGLRAEVLYVPLRVQRSPGGEIETDALLSLRVQLSRAMRH
jgi:hypothetical protein